MEIAKSIGGFSPAEADDLRKAIGKKIHELMAEIWNEDTSAFPYTGNAKPDPRNAPILTIGPLWRRWYATGGKEGAEPPPEFAELRMRIMPHLMAHAARNPAFGQGDVENLAAASDERPLRVDFVLARCLANDGDGGVRNDRA